MHCPAAVGDSNEACVSTGRPGACGARMTPCMAPSLAASASDASMVGAAYEEASKIRLRLAYGGAFEQSPSSGSMYYRYVGGEYFNESVPSNWGYADFMFKLSEKFKTAVSAKYQAPGEELDPATLITVADDDDLQEMCEEYTNHLLRPNTPTKTFRIRVFVFPAAEEPLTPDEIMDGEDFFAVRHVATRLRYDTSLGHSSWGSTLSSSGTPSARVGPDAKALRQSAMSSAPIEAPTDPLGLAAMQPPSRTSTPVLLASNPFDASFDEALLGRMRMSVNSPNIWAGYGFGGAAAAAVTAHGGGGGGRPGCAWGAPPAGEYARSACAPALEAEAMGFDESEIEALEEGLRQERRARKRHSSGSGRASGSAASDAVPPPRGGGGAGTTDPVVAWTPRQLPVDPWNMTHGAEEAATPALDATHEHLASAAAAAVGADRGVGGGGHSGGLRLPSHISEFGDDSTVAPSGAGDTPMGHGAAEAPGRSAAAAAADAAATDAAAALAHALQHAGSGDSLQGLSTLRPVHRVAKAQVRVSHSIGEGAFGEVSLASVPLYGTVAIKWLKHGRLSKHSKSFWHEAGMLADLNHPNVLRFYGIVTDDGGEGAVVGIMTEYVRGGSLAQYLKDAGTQRLSLAHRCELALHATNGLAYLHELRVVHFDLKPDNLLLEMAHLGHDSGGGGCGGSSDDGGSPGRFGSAWRGGGGGGGVGFGVPVVKVADFGLSKHKLNSYVSSCRDLRGTLPYMAPELVADPERVSEKADVWSMGVVMWEMLTREAPYAELQPQQILMGLMCGNLHLDVPSWCEPEWRGLLEAAMEPNPNARPSMRELARQLEAILEQQRAG